MRRFFRFPTRDSITRDEARALVESEIRKLREMTRGDIELYVPGGRLVRTERGAGSRDYVVTTEIEEERGGSLHVLVYSYGDRWTEYFPPTDGFFVS